MCIIGIKEKDNAVKFKDLEAEIRECFRCNSHGAGVAWRADNQVTWIKGITNADSLVRICKRLHGQGGEYIWHARIATHGGQSAGLTHPFVVDSDYTPMRKIVGHTKRGVVFHNGIFSWAERQPEVSDTMQFVKKYVDGCWAEWKAGSPLCELASESGGRIVLMTPKATVCHGDWCQSKDTGVWYSNGGYRLIGSYSGYSYQYDLSSCQKASQTVVTRRDEVDMSEQAHWTCPECFTENNLYHHLCIACRRSKYAKNLNNEMPF